MNIISTIEAGWHGQTAQITRDIKATVCAWRRERAMMRQRRLTETLHDRSLRQIAQRSANFVPLLEESAAASAAASALRAEYRPATPIRKRRSKFYRWQPNPIRNSVPVVVQ